MSDESQKTLAGRNIVLGLCGGISCYKSASLASMFIRASGIVSVVMTDAAQKFITPLTFKTLTGRDVCTSLWDADVPSDINHISLANWADLLVIAPATANIIAKSACGIADDVLSTLILSAGNSCDILLAPAMNERMWQAVPTRENMKKLITRGFHVIGPAEGMLACGDVGVGRMSEPSEIFDRAVELLDKEKRFVQKNMRENMQKNGRKNMRENGRK